MTTNDTPYRPMPGWLLVRPDPQKEVRDSGLLVPKNPIRRQIVGTVLALGRPLPLENGDPNWGSLQDSDGHPVEIGDRVMYLRHSGTGIEKDDDVSLIFLRHMDVIARVIGDEGGLSTVIAKA